MKPLLLTLLGLLFLASTAFAQGFVEEFRSEPNRRPPAEAWYSYGTAAARIDDLNSNGAPDMPFMLGQTLAVYDGQTRERLMQVDTPDHLTDLSHKLGFFNFYDKVNRVYEATHLVLASVTAGANPMDIFIIDAETGEIVWQMQNARPMTIADLDNDGRPELLVGDRDNRQVVMVGWDGGGSAVQSASPPSAEWSAPAGGGYDLALKYESEPGLDLAYDGTLVATLDDLDVNGDSVPEIVMVIEDDNGDPVGLVVRNGAAHDVQWQFEFPDSGLARDDILNGFHGFYDVNGDGQREALFGHRTAVTLDKTVHTLDEDFEMLAVHDLDGDGFADLVGRGVQNNTVQVWGAEGSTGVSREDLIGAGFELRQNYPNPFREATTIAYKVEQPGPVTISVYDMLGRRVRTLVDTRQTPGTYHVAWDGRDEAGQLVASGQYFYRLRIGEAVASKQALRIR